MSEYRVNVYESEFSDEIVGRVRYNQELDFWNGQNWQNGGTGRHLGITKLKDDRFVLIKGTDWVGEKDRAYVVDDYEALKQILKAGRTELLLTKKFASLGKLYKENMIDEVEDNEEV